MIIERVNSQIMAFLISVKRKLIKYDQHKEQYLAYIKRLIGKGLKIGKNVTIETTVSIDSTYPYLISIGDNCSLAAHVSLIAHDETPAKFTGGYARLGMIEIKENCFIGENCVILPGVTIGPNVLIAAGSVVNKDIPGNSCVAGVPARFYAKFDEYIENTNKQIESRPHFLFSDLHAAEVDETLKDKVRQAVQEGICFVLGKPRNSDLYILWNPNSEQKVMCNKDIALLLLIFFLSGCERKAMYNTLDLLDLHDISAVGWSELAQKKIYFGHQSVGYNIIAGVKDILKESPEIKLDITDRISSNDMANGFFYHSELGNNCDPVSKIEDFKRMIETEVGDKIDLAFFKLCYVDITRNSDVEALFEKYSSTMDYLEKKYPHVIFLHFTAPLTTLPGGIKARVKRFLSGFSFLNENKIKKEFEDNSIKRNEFNELVLMKYQDKVFDLASYESHCLNGKVSCFTRDGNTYAVLCDSFTNDGGHLNRNAAKMIAARFLEFLAKHQYGKNE